MLMLPTRVDVIRIRGRSYYVKRDDLIDVHFSGNKYRKLSALLASPAGRYERIVSWGGNQSNAMLSIAALCRRKGWRFEYVSKAVPARLRQHPTGNLKLALDLGMQLQEIPAKDHAVHVAAMAGRFDSRTLLLAQGGADLLAGPGIRQLADEIAQWQADRHIRQLNVVTPSGTGTTAALLADAMPRNSILTTAAAGDRDGLHRQIEKLLPVPANLHVLQAARPFRFACPDAELLAVYDELLAAGIEFDLIYGALMWHVLLAHAGRIDGDILYVHSGGLAGNETMLDRYRHMGVR